MCGFRLESGCCMGTALAAELPDAEAEAGHEQDEEYPEERGRPLIQLFGP